MFKKWKQRRLIKKIKQKRLMLDKLKEEIIKMGKLAIKDGKLIRKDDDIMPQPNEGFPQQMQAPPQTAPVTNPMYQRQTVYPQEQPQPQYRQPIDPPPLPPQYNPPPQYRQELPPTVVIITLSNGQQLNVSIPAQSVEQFIGEVDNAINNQSSITIGNQVINGRYILSVTL